MPAVSSILDIAPLDLAPVYAKTGLKMRFLFDRAAKSDAILTLSEFSRERIVDRLRVDESRIVVAPLAPNPAFAAARQSTAMHDGPQPYVVTVVDMATPDPRKRAGWVSPIERKLRQAGVALEVIGAGTNGGGVLAYSRGLGRLSDDRMAERLAGALCFLYFSAYEGQGLPPLEAMATGVPVVAVKNTAVAEVVGGAGVLIRDIPGNWAVRLDDGGAASDAVQSELVDACLSFSRDAKLRADYAERSRRQAGLFSEQRFQAGVDRAYRLAVERKAA
jgi:glycosyltransferase involved in cell wall biosynthesis